MTPELDAYEDLWKDYPYCLRMRRSFDLSKVQSTILQCNVIFFLSENLNYFLENNIQSAECKNLFPVTTTTIRNCAKLFPQRQRCTKTVNRMCFNFTFFLPKKLFHVGRLPKKAQKRDGENRKERRRKDLGIIELFQICYRYFCTHQYLPKVYGAGSKGR